MMTNKETLLRLYLIACKVVLTVSFVHAQEDRFSRPTSKQYREDSVFLRASFFD
jgi:hypothetical protein